MTGMRRFKQIACTEIDIYAVSDDGIAYQLTGSKWQRMEPLPQDGYEEHEESEPERKIPDDDYPF